MQKKYRVAVIGSTGRGDYGHGLDTVWLRLAQTEIVAVADDDPQGLAGAAARLGGVRGFADYRQMLDETALDIVAVCPRWIDRHHAMVMAAVERGIHVYVEKPLCRTLAEADAIVKASAATHALVAVAHQTRYSPILAMAKQLIAEGKLGRVLECRGRGKEDHRGGGEDLWVLGSHVVDMIRVLAGDARWCFASVTRDGRPIVREDVVEGNEGIGLLAGDGVQAMYGMTSGATAFFSSHREGGSPLRFGVQVLGTAGILEIGMGYLPAARYLADPSWSFGRLRGDWQQVTSDGIGRPEPLKDGGLDRGNEVAVLDLIAAIEEHRQPEMNAIEARAAMEMIVGCFESARTGAVTSLPLVERGNPLERLGG